jgi:AraC family transcriptional regulator
MSIATAPRYQGDFVAWNGGAMFIGAGAGAIDPHSHYAIQLVTGTPTGPRVQFGRREAWQEAPAALIPSRATHSIDVAGCRMSVVIFIEPETAEGRALGARLQGRPEIVDEAALASAVARLEEAWRTQASADALRATCQQLVRDLARTTSREPSDPRVLQAVAYLRERVSQAVTLEEVAAAVGLSPSRFRHLFVEETGMPLRTYALWRRLLHVWELLMEGETLAGAAHAAGFADSAHLSRTSRTMFGLPPSVMQMVGPLSARARAARDHLA